MRVCVCVLYKFLITAVFISNFVQEVSNKEEQRPISGSEFGTIYTVYICKVFFEAKPCPRMLVSRKQSQTFGIKGYLHYLEENN